MNRLLTILKYISCTVWNTLLWQKYQMSILINPLKRPHSSLSLTHVQRSWPPSCMAAEVIKSRKNCSQTSPRQQTAAQETRHPQKGTNGVLKRPDTDRSGGSNYTDQEGPTGFVTHRKCELHWCHVGFVAEHKPELSSVVTGGRQIWLPGTKSSLKLI